MNVIQYQNDMFSFFTERCDFISMQAFQALAYFLV